MTIWIDIFNVYGSDYNKHTIKDRNIGIDRGNKRNI